MSQETRSLGKMNSRDIIIQRCSSSQLYVAFFFFFYRPQCYCLVYITGLVSVAGDPSACLLAQNKIPEFSAFLPHAGHQRRVGKPRGSREGLRRVAPQ